MTRIFLHIIIILTLLSCNENPHKKASKVTESIKTEEIDSVVKFRTDGTKEFKILTKNGLKSGNGYLFDQNENVVGLKHYENDTLNGYGLLLNENTFRPKYLYETNNGKKDGVIIEFYDEGIIKSFRSADIYNYSQKIKFHKNGVIKSIGQTENGGKAQGTWLYFDENGKLEKSVEYENGNTKK
ncbi:hypothetical protein [Aquimarina sp. AU474]|uniref:hypothetical protein n=1 Tax=Aquimarina sp. AU474 TaxID=2108529 RepID=UPI000D689FF5|nr:hypothetical protein [Aquimarina sp. AU474]